MDASWNLAKANSKPIDYTQFVTLTGEFTNAAEQWFGTFCNTTIRLMDSTKANDNFDMSFALLSSYAEINQEKVIFETHNLLDVSQEKWAEARYVDVIVQPKDQTEPGYASAEFKGDLPQAASFYVQHDNALVTAAIKQHMMASNRQMLIGDGSKSNSGGFGPAIFARNESELVSKKQQLRQGSWPSFAGVVLETMGFVVP